MLAGTATASAGSDDTGVALTLLGSDTVSGGLRSYAVRAVSDDGTGPASTSVTGYRGVGSPVYAWQRSAGDVASGFSVLPGATSTSHLDAGAPADGSGRYYRASVVAAGATPVTTAAVRGFRAVRPVATTSPAGPVTVTSLEARGGVDSVGVPAAIAAGLCVGPDPNPALGGATSTCQALGVPSAGTTLAHTFGGLAAETTYHVRAYAVHPLLGASYGADVTAQTLPTPVALEVTATPDAFVMHAADLRQTVVTVRNADTVPTRSVAAVALSGWDLGTTTTVASTCTEVLAPGATCTVTFELTATTPGNDTFAATATAAPAGSASATLTSSVADACPATCGVSGTENCCASVVVPGNAPGATLAGEVFYRGYDEAPDNYNSTSFPATVSDYRLDLYEVTVGRFRQFLDAGYGTQAQPPATGAGAHARLPGSGWDAAWNANLQATRAELDAALQCNSNYRVWSVAPGAHEFRPLNCVNWYEAMAFCIWDGGYLPTELEWSYAAAGGSEHRAYPWSVPASSIDIDDTRASYNAGGTALCRGDNVNGCSINDLIRPGTKPAGNARWGHAEMAGNVSELTLDWSAATYSSGTCSDCANLTPAIARVERSGYFFYEAFKTRSAYRYQYQPTARNFFMGFRCARAP